MEQQWQVREHLLREHVARCRGVDLAVDRERALTGERFHRDRARSALAVIEERSGCECGTAIDARGHEARIQIAAGGQPLAVPPWAHGHPRDDSRKWKERHDTAATRKTAANNQQRPRRAAGSLWRRAVTRADRWPVWRRSQPRALRPPRPRYSPRRARPVVVPVSRRGCRRARAIAEMRHRDRARSAASVQRQSPDGAARCRRDVAVASRRARPDLEQRAADEGDAHARGRGSGSRGSARGRSPGVGCAQRARHPRTSPAQDP